MGKAADKLIDYLRGSKDAWRSTISTFPEVDVLQLARDMRLEERSAEQNNQDDMVRNGDGLDIVEQEIVSDIARRQRIAQSDYCNAMDLYEARLRSSAMGDEVFVSIKRIGEEGLGNMEAQAEEDRLSLVGRGEAFNLVQVEFRSFARKHGLTEVAPILVSHQEKKRVLLWIAVVVFVEAVLNGMFFAEGSEMGLIGGAVEALGLSALNVALAAVIGLFAVRYIRHSFIRWRLTAGIALVLLAGLVIGLNLLIAHYREAFALAAGTKVGFREVLQSTALRPFSLNDVRSWLLGVLGVVINIFSAYKFSQLDDPYPRFGALAARVEKERAVLTGARKQCIETLTEHRNDATDSMQSVINAVTACKHDFEVALRSRHRMHKQYRDYIEGLEQACVTLGCIYCQGLGVEMRKPLSAHLPQPDDIESAFSPSSGSHDRAIQAMSRYIDQISKVYKKLVADVGAGDLEVIDAPATI